ncbi:hypothetical protein DFJ74DRAFT_597849, partial [Hyaloraphidium curvatum]
LLEVNRIIHGCALAGRTAAALDAFELLPDLGFAPDVRSHNGVLLAHVRARDLPAAAAAFRAMLAAGVAPNEHTFGTLIKGCVDAGKLHAAYRLYEDLKARGIAPNLHIFTTLIAGCVDAGDLARAWRTFDHARNALNILPDRDLYATMMSCAAKDGSAERALDLHAEMVGDRGIEPTAFTYTAAIAACMRRPDFHAEAFRLLAQMLARGLVPSLATYDGLLVACARAGDLLGARDVWNAAMAHPEIAPDDRFAANMLMAYAYAVGDWFVHLEGEVERATRGRRIRDHARDPAASRRVLPVDDAVAECRALFNWMVRRDRHTDGSKGGRLVGAAAVHRYLELHGRHPLLRLKLVETMEVLEPLLQGQEWGGLSRFYVATAVTNDARLMARHGDAFFREHLFDWDARKEAALERLSLSPGEREKRRADEGRGRKEWSRFFVGLANGAARTGDHEAAFRTIADMHAFRQPYYLAKPDARDLSPVLALCWDLATDGDAGPLRNLRRLVPEEPDTPLEEVQRHLRRRWMGSGWWGWEAIGVERKRVLAWEARARKE